MTRRAASTASLSSVSSCRLHTSSRAQFQLSHLDSVPAALPSLWRGHLLHFSSRQPTSFPSPYPRLIRTCVAPSLATRVVSPSLSFCHSSFPPTCPATVMRTASPRSPLACPVLRAVAAAAARVEVVVRAAGRPSLSVVSPLGRPSGCVLVGNGGGRSGGVRGGRGVGSGGGGRVSGGSSGGGGSGGLVGGGGGGGSGGGGGGNGGGGGGDGDIRGDKD